MALRKEIDLKFSDEFSGFHNYDLNISFECIKEGYKIVVTEGILIEHLSIGTRDRAWVESVIKIHQRYEDILPLYLGENSPEKDLEFENGKKISDILLNHGMIKEALLYWLKFLKYGPLSSYHLIFFKKVYQACLR